MWGHWELNIAIKNTIIFQINNMYKNKHTDLLCAIVLSTWHSNNQNIWVPHNHNCRLYCVAMTCIYDHRKRV